MNPVSYSSPIPPIILDFINHNKIKSIIIGTPLPLGNSNSYNSMVRTTNTSTMETVTNTTMPKQRNSYILGNTASSPYLYRLFHTNKSYP